MDMARLTKVYIKIREARSELKRGFDEKDTELKDKQALIEGQMLKFLNENGMDSSKTAAGTFYKQENVNPVGRDWESFYEWIRENNAFDALQRRIKKEFVTTYMEENDGAMPPGVDIHREYVVRVRK